MRKWTVRDDPFVKLIRQHGYRKVQRAVNYAVGWAWLEADLGRAPTTSEYVELASITRTGAFREIAAFREITGLQDPSEVVARARKAGLSFKVKGRPEPADGLALVPFLAAG